MSVLNKFLNLYSGKIFPNSNGEWLLDGEYITSDKNNKKINLYMIFDVYFATHETSKPAYMYKFYGKKNENCRADILNSFKYVVQNSDDDILRINFKEYSKGETKYREGKNSIILDKV